MSTDLKSVLLWPIYVQIQAIASRSLRARFKITWMLLSREYPCRSSDAKLGGIKDGCKTEGSVNVDTSNDLPSGVNCQDAESFLSISPLQNDLDLRPEIR